MDNNEKVSCSKKELLNTYKHALAERAYYNSQTDVEWQIWDTLISELELLFGEEFFKENIRDKLVVDNQETNPFQIGDEVMFADRGTDDEIHVVDRIDGMNLVIDGSKIFPSEMFVLFERKNEIMKNLLNYFIVDNFDDYFNRFKEVIVGLKRKYSLKELRKISLTEQKELVDNKIVTQQEIDSANEQPCFDWQIFKKTALHNLFCLILPMWMFYGSAILDGNNMPFGLHVLMILLTLVIIYGTFHVSYRSRYSKAYLIFDDAIFFGIWVGPIALIKFLSTIFS